jgi:hypothetical protein
MLHKLIYVRNAQFRTIFGRIYSIFDIFSLIRTFLKIKIIIIKLKTYEYFELNFTKILFYYAQ